MLNLVAPAKRQPAASEFAPAALGGMTDEQVPQALGRLQKENVQVDEPGPQPTRA